MRALVMRIRPDGQIDKKLETDWPAPEPPQAHEIKIQTLYSGVSNGTERSFITRGPYQMPDEWYPGTFGYQNVGRVVEIGAEVTRFTVGERVYSSTDHHAFVVAPEDGLLVKLPDNVESTHAAIFGMASVAMRTCRHAELDFGDRVLVVGAGLIGQIAAQIATLRGARVTMVNLSEPRLVIARDLGFVEATIAGDDWPERIPAESFDVVMDFAGAPGTENDMINALRRRGQLLMIAGRRDVTYSLKRFQHREIAIKQNQHFEPDDLAHLCWLVSKRLLNFEPLITRVIPVDEAVTVYDTLRANPHALFGTVFDWQSE